METSVKVSFTCFSARNLPVGVCLGIHDTDLERGLRVLHCEKQTSLRTLSCLSLLDTFCHSFVYRFVKLLETQKLKKKESCWYHQSLNNVWVLIWNVFLPNGHICDEVLRQVCVRSFALISWDLDEAKGWRVPIQADQVLRPGGCDTKAFPQQKMQDAGFQAAANSSQCNF